MSLVTALLTKQAQQTQPLLHTNMMPHACTLLNSTQQAQLHLQGVQHLSQSPHVHCAVPTALARSSVRPQAATTTARSSSTAASAAAASTTTTGSCCWRQAATAARVDDSAKPLLQIAGKRVGHTHHQVLCSTHELCVRGTGTQTEQQGKTNKQSTQTQNRHKVSQSLQHLHVLVSEASACTGTVLPGQRSVHASVCVRPLCTKPTWQETVYPAIAPPPCSFPYY